MSFLIDPCVPDKFKSILEEWGYAASFVKDHAPPNSPDPQVLMLAQTLDAILLTVDMGFSNIFELPSTPIPRNYCYAL